MRIFLTGPTGYIGSAVLEALLRSGHQVTGLVREQRKARQLAAQGVGAVIGDICNSEWRDAAVGHDVLIHAARQRGAKRIEADRLALDTLISAAKSTGGHPRLIYTSSAWVLGPTPKPVSEEAAVHAPALVAWRPAHEQHLLGATGLLPIVVRPGTVYGGRRGILGDLFRDGLNGLVRVIGDGRNRWATVYHRDLGDLYARLAVAPDASGIYHATDEASEPVMEVVEALSRNTTHKPDIRHVPIEEARLKMGPLADVLVMDQVVRAPRSRAMGWSPSLRSIAGSIPRLLEEWRGEGS